MYVPYKRLKRVHESIKAHMQRHADAFKLAQTQMQEDIFRSSHQPAARRDSAVHNGTYVVCRHFVTKKLDSLFSLNYSYYIKQIKI